MTTCQAGFGTSGAPVVQIQQGHPRGFRGFRHGESQWRTRVSGRWREQRFGDTDLGNRLLIREEIMRARFGIFASFASAMQAGSALEVMENRGDMLGWEAVGRLDLPSGFCTGVLISKDQVLTAAHCLFERKTARKIDVKGAVFGRVT